MIKNNKRVRVLLTGANGQLGQEIQSLCQSEPYSQLVDLHTCNKSELDISNPQLVKQVFEALQPDCIINAAAYTAVDTAENEKSKAFAVNAKGPLVLAEQAQGIGARLIHISTDYVFDGKASVPYCANDNKNPINVYGQSKSEGEDSVLAASANNIVIRTGWVYSVYGNNFVKTMLRLMNEKDELSVVEDQIGTPTWAKTLADISLKAAVMSDLNKGQVFHWSNAGVASWYDFAKAIYDEGRRLKLIQSPCRVIPTQAINFPVIAKRPAYSVLNKCRVIETFKPDVLHWRDALTQMLEHQAFLLEKKEC